MDPNVDGLLNQYEALLARHAKDQNEAERIRDRLAGMAEAWKILYPDRPALQLLLTQRRQREESVRRLGFPGRST